MMKFTKTQDRIIGRIRSQNSKLSGVPQQAFTFFRNITPKDTGNARSKTRLSRDTIRAEYPYAGRLDNGWSKQFGGLGMSRPTIKYVRDLINKILGR